jgi:uncharacterized protein DUF4410
MKTILALVVCLPAICLIAGCASGSIQAVAYSGTPVPNHHLVQPSHIFVAPVDATQATCKVDADEIAQTQAKVKSDLQKNLVEELGDIAPTTIGSGNTGWLVVVMPTHVDPGSAAMRAIVGFGSGQSKINAKFSLYSLDQGETTPIVENLAVEADTGMQSGYSTLGEGNGMDSRRIAREIRKYLESRLPK